MPASRLARRILPHPDTLSQTKGLRWLGHYLAPRPWLWVAHRRRVAMGVAVGLAVGVVPLPTQMVLAAVAAIACRANVAAAVAATWLTNPLTLVPIWSLAILLGRLASGHSGPVATPETRPHGCSGPGRSSGFGFRCQRQQPYWPKPARVTRDPPPRRGLICRSL